MPAHAYSRSAPHTLQYLALVDGDDFIAPSMLEKMVAKAQEHDPPLDFVVANFAIVDEKLNLSPNYDEAHFWGLVEESRKGVVLKPHTHPALFEISPVPWRKLYNMDFIRRHSLRFPEV
jgi:hypothetical protein